MGDQYRVLKIILEALKNNLGMKQISFFLILVLAYRSSSTSVFQGSEFILELHIDHFVTIDNYLCSNHMYCFGEIFRANISIAIKRLRVLIRSVSSQPNWPFIMQNGPTFNCGTHLMHLHLTVVRIVDDDWSIWFGENRPDQSSQAFDGYAANITSSVFDLFLSLDL